jgi:hypothetical protein
MYPTYAQAVTRTWLVDFRGILSHITRFG